MKKKSFWSLTGRDVVGMIGRKIWGEARMPFRRGKYGQVAVDIGTWQSYKGRTYKIPPKRKDKYKKAWSYYIENQFARPITNLTASAVFGKGVQFVGDNIQVAFANKLFGQIDLFSLGVESGLDGDNFIRTYKENEEYKLVLLPPETMDKEIRDDNVADLKGYVQFQGNDDLEETFEPKEIKHIMQNAVSNSLYGNGDLTHLFYWFDLYDSTTEEADKRRMFASQPIGVFTGVIMRFKAALKTMLGKKSRDVDQKIGLRRSLPPGSNLMLPTGMDYHIIEPGGKFDLEEILNRIAKVIAMASETPLHWLLLAEQINRATAKEMGFPFIKKILRKQKLFGDCFIKILKGIYDEDPEALGFDEEENEEGDFQLEAKFPPIFDYELEEIEKMVNSILKVLTSGNLSDKTALDLICNYFGLDVEEEQKRLEDEETNKEDENEDEEFGKVDKAVGAIGAAVARGELKKKTATKLIKRLVGEE